MDVNKVLKLCFPVIEGETILEATGRSSRRALKEFVKRWEKEDTIPFQALVDFGSRGGNGPSLMLSDSAQAGLFAFLSKGTRAATKAALGRRVERSMSLTTTYWWHRRLAFREDGTVDYTAGQDYSAEVAEIRKDFLK